MHFFYIELKCLAEGDALVRVTMSDPAKPKNKLSWYFRKSCAQERRKDLVVYVNDEEVTSHGGVQDRWKAPIVYLAELVNVTMTVRNGNQKVDNISVVADIQSVIRGAGAKGGIIEKPYTFFVGSSCPVDIQEGKVAVTIHIPPYDALHLYWLYECPLCEATNHSAHPPSIDIGTMIGGNDIVAQGILTSNQPAVLSVGTETYVSSFYVTGKDEMAQGYLTTNMRILDPSLHCTRSGQYHKCTLTYRCHNRGEAEVLVTLPFPKQHQTLEFTYQKTCRKPKIIVSEEVVTDSVAITVCAVVVMAAVWLCACWQSRLVPVKTHTRDIPI